MTCLCVLCLSIWNERNKCDFPLAPSSPTPKHHQNYMRKSVLTLASILRCNGVLMRDITHSGWQVQPPRCTCARRFSRRFKWVSSRNILARRGSRECPSPFSRTRLLLAIPLNPLFVNLQSHEGSIRMTAQHLTCMTVVVEDHNVCSFSCEWTVIVCQTVMLSSVKEFKSVLW